MREIHQKQSQNTKKQDLNNPNVQTETQNNSQNIICPNCNAELPGEAFFCSECGFSVGQHHCPKCGAPASPTADICQDCGAWLLEGQCKFCYAEIPDEALFCPECGKPKDGIQCPHCGKLSIFDFCSGCGKPVTEEAVAELQRAQEALSAQAAAPDTAVPKTFSSNQEARRWFSANNHAQTAKIETELADLEALINSGPEPVPKYEPEPEEIANPTPAPPPVRKPLFSDRQLESIRKTGAAVDEVTRQRIEAERIAEEKRKAEEAERKRKEEERKRQEEERKRQEEERRRREAERQRQIKEAQERKEALEKLLRARAWRCNAYGSFHSGGPNECADPRMGGHWVDGAGNRI